MKKEELVKRIVAISVLVYVCAKKGSFGEMAAVAKVGNRNLTVEEIRYFLKNNPREVRRYFNELLEYAVEKGIIKNIEDELMKTAIKEGNAKKAEKIAVARGRKLSCREVDALLLGAAESVNDDNDVFRVLELEPSQRALNKFILSSTQEMKGEPLIHDKRLDELFAVVKKDVSKRYKESLIRFCLERYPFYFFDALRIIGRKPTQKEIDRLVEIEVKHEPSCGDAVRTAKECKASPRAVNKLVRACIRKGALSAGAWAVALGPSKKNIEALLRACILDGDSSGVKIALTALKRKISSTETDQLIDACIIKRGFSQNFTEALEIAGRDLTEDEKCKLLKNTIKNGWVGSSITAVNMLGRELTVNEIIKLKNNYLKKQ